MNTNKRIVLTYGTFDLYHVGHINLLERAKRLGDHLIVGVSSDTFNEKKEKKAFYKFEDRIRIVESCRYVDQTIREDSWDQKEQDIKKYGVNIFVMGDDWAGKFDHLKHLCDVKYLPRTPGISSTYIRENSGKSPQNNAVPN